MRHNLNNQALPGIQVERTITLGKELARVQVFKAGEYVGEIVYISRRVARGTAYGWRIARSAPQSKLFTKTEAAAVLVGA
jgi:hypothetical protein